MKARKKIALVMAVVLAGLCVTGCSENAGRRQQISESRIVEGEEETKDTGKKEKTIKKEYTYDSLNRDAGISDFPESIEENGKIYRIESPKDIHYDIIQNREVILDTQKVSVKKESDVPERIIKRGTDGVDYVLLLGEERLEEGTVEVTTYKEVDYPDYVTVPKDVPGECEIDVTVNGKDSTIVGKLVEMEQITEYRWKDDFIVTGCFTGLNGAETYRLSGTDAEIRYDDETPTWQGYEKDILRAAGLPAESYEITAGEWDGRQKKAGDGMVMRYAKYTGRQYCADYRAVYEGTYETNGLSGTVFYWADADETVPKDMVSKLYTIHADITYHFVGNTN